MTSSNAGSAASWPALATTAAYGVVVPITFQLSADRAAAVTFAVSPIVELAWAWHVLVGTEHHPERAEWGAAGPR
ncbi:DUF5937 family protein [Micromonospora sp. NPDC005215]|uniref:DUF5937 family protein n=1 Tax=Micromonospora sp. NPDC005215 TaxID=3157024 RepID=UPI0033B0AD3E